MHVKGKNYRAIRADKKNKSVRIINQLKIPFEFEIIEINSYSELVNAIKDMRLRGAPLIGVAGAYAVWLACVEAIDNKNPQKFLKDAFKNIITARPTAVNLKFATCYIYNKVLIEKNFSNWENVAYKFANEYYENEIDSFRKIGEYGLEIIKQIAKQKKGKVVNILTHCNAGWLACGDYGTATSPIYLAHQNGIKVHVWVDETRPRFQGAKLTAWEMYNEKVPFTVITDNTGGHIMQQGLVDIVIVGADRVAANGDVANKIGTYLKALAAFDNKLPFYVALPVSTIDFNLKQGVGEIVIEKRSTDEVVIIDGISNKEKIQQINLMPKNYNSENYAFDVTPNRLITGIITEKGVVKANFKEIIKLKSNMYGR